MYFIGLGNASKESAEMLPPAIPPIEDPELLSAVSALARSACVMRTLFLMVAEGKSAKGLLVKHDELTTMADVIIDKWRDHLGIDLEDLPVN